MNGVPSADVRRRDESIIRRTCGLGAVVAITYENEGWDSRVYLVDRGNLVFKFARRGSVRDQYRDEIAVLRDLEPLDTPVRTPRVRWVAPDFEYFGYEGIAGEPLSDVLAELSRDTWAAIGDTLGRFLAVLHGRRLDGARRMDEEAEIAEYHDKYRLAVPTLRTAFAEAELRAIEAFVLDRLPTELRRLGCALRLGHGDLGPWNVVVGIDQRLGVIDFGDVAYHDESKDFSGLGNETITNAALDAYGASARLCEKAALRSRAFPLLDLPFYLGKDDEAGVRACLELVRRTIVEGTRSGTRFDRSP
jgi:aminoglycoside phosphotransferase (APT) family kinase protein